MSARVEALLYVAAAGLGVFVAYRVVNSVKGKLPNLNPADPANVVNKAANAIVQAVTGDPNATIGGKVYEWTHPNEPRADAPVTVGPGRVSPNAAALVAQFGGDKLTRDDLAWMKEQLYGADVQTADVEDAEQGQFMRLNNPAAAAADRLNFAVKP